jgi:hypothetical protein
MDVVDAITELEIDEFGRWGPRDRPYPVEAVLVKARLTEAGDAAVVAQTEGSAAR